MVGYKQVQMDVANISRSEESLSNLKFIFCFMRSQDEFCNRGKFYLALLRLQLCKTVF